MKTIFCLILIAHFSTFAAEPAADVLSSVLNGGGFHYKLEKKWIKFEENSNNLFLTGAEYSDGFKPTVFISFLKLSGVQFNAAYLEASSDEYFEGRTQYVSSKGGSVLSTSPYETQKWSGISEAHRIGVTYKIAETIYHEYSYYVSCNGKIFHLKSLDFGAGEKSKSADEVEKVIQGFSCL